MTKPQVQPQVDIQNDVIVNKRGDSLTKWQIDNAQRINSCRKAVANAFFSSEEAYASDSIVCAGLALNVPTSGKPGSYIDVNGIGVVNADEVQVKENGKLRPVMEGDYVVFVAHVNRTRNSNSLRPTLTVSGPTIVLVGRVPKTSYEALANSQNNKRSRFAQASQTGPGQAIMQGSAITGGR